MVQFDERIVFVIHFANDIFLEVILDEKERKMRVLQLLSASSELAHLRATCHHNWGPRIYDPEDTFIERPTGQLEVHGSDVWPMSEFIPAKKDRWSETCKVCLVKRYFSSRQ